jgi:hypothetical protein
VKLQRMMLKKSLSRLWKSSKKPQLNQKTTQTLKKRKVKPELFAQDAKETLVLAQDATNVEPSKIQAFKNFLNFTDREVLRTKLKFLENCAHADKEDVHADKEDVHAIERHADHSQTNSLRNSLRIISPIRIIRRLLDNCAHADKEDVHADKEDAHSNKEDAHSIK